MALAGGVSVRVPHRQGYYAPPGSVCAPDGHCRAFDARAQGTLFGSGLGVVVLKPLAAALREGDTVFAVIKGSAINNDGASKVSYTAPSLERQAEVVVEALACAGVDPDTISYVEAHGTGTRLGDPIEVAALSRAFQVWTQRRGYCALGSVKTNVGHLDAAAGVAGLIKIVLSLEHEALPASLHFEQPNPEIDFQESPFYVNTALQPWVREGHRMRRAGVSALGVGGTNAHVIVEEAPTGAPSGASRAGQVLMWSARTAHALEAATSNLARYLDEKGAGVALGDIAYTLQVGRREWSHRRVLVCQNQADARAALAPVDHQRVWTAQVQGTSREVVFMFSGGGAQYVGMGQGLYDTERVFRDHIDRGLAMVSPHINGDLYNVLFAPADAVEEAAAAFERPSVQLPVIFIIEYALAQLWMAWGVQPGALLGHSMGENTAACLAGVFTFEEALNLVVLRGQLFERIPAGGMMSVPIDIRDIAPWLGDDLDLAAVNRPGACVVSGPPAALDRLERQLAVQNLETQRVRIALAAHSRMLDPMLHTFGAYLEQLVLRPPTIPFISNRTGTWITIEQATDPLYWVEHLRHTIRFSDGLTTLLQDPDRLFLEVGPGQTLGAFVNLHPDKKANQVVLASLRHPLSNHPDVTFILETVGRLWLAGIPFNWDGFYADERRHRVPLPGYPFEHQPYWFKPDEPEGQAPERPRRPGWFSRRRDGWRRWLRKAARPALAPVAPAPETTSDKQEPLVSDTSSPTPLEESLLMIWREMLGTPHVGRADDFFDLGGNSLLVTQTVARINEVFQVDLSVLNLLESPTVAGLARRIESVHREEAPPWR